MLLSSTVATNNFLFTADAANLDVFRQGSVAIHRRRVAPGALSLPVADSCFEQLHFVNHGLDELKFPSTDCFDADFADIFEIRGTEERARTAPDSPDLRQYRCAGYEGLDRIVRETLIESNIAS